MPEYLVIRLSSIGDIVLTTPVLRSIKQAQPEAKIHFLIKKQYKELLEYNPYVDKLILFEGKLKNTLKILKKEKYDYLIDLHGSLRSFLVRNALNVPSVVFQKKNFQKHLITKLRRRKPVEHVVIRYLKTLEKIDIPPDYEGGLDFFIPQETERKIKTLLQNRFSSTSVLGIVLGGTYKTKKWLPEYYAELLQKIGQPVVLLGGKTETADAEYIEKNITVPVLNVVGKASLLESAAFLKFSEKVIAHDTGLMHIAAAFRKPILTIWGNTSPLFGMTPYGTRFLVAENKELRCHPCHKLGHSECPKKHFKCIRELTPEKVFSLWRKL